MSLKSQKKHALVSITIGAVLFLVSLLLGVNDYQSGLLSTMSAVMLAIGIVRLLRIHRIEKDPDRKADYEAAQKDERIVYIANKARSLTFVITVYLELVAGLAAIFLFDQRLLGEVLCYLTCFQCLLFTGLYRYYSKKY